MFVIVILSIKSIISINKMRYTLPIYHGNRKSLLNKIFQLLFDAINNKEVNHIEEYFIYTI